MCSDRTADVFSTLPGIPPPLWADMNRCANLFGILIMEGVGDFPVKYRILVEAGEPLWGWQTSGTQAHSEHEHPGWVVCVLRRVVYCRSAYLCTASCQTLNSEFSSSEICPYPATARKIWFPTPGFEVRHYRLQDYPSGLKTSLIFITTTTFSCKTTGRPEH